MAQAGDDRKVVCTRTQPEWQAALRGASGWAWRSSSFPIRRGTSAEVRRRRSAVEVGQIAKSLVFMADGKPVLAVLAEATASTPNDSASTWQRQMSPAPTR